MRIRPIQAHEWIGLREVRLRALADAPMAFGSTLAAEQDRPDDHWRDRARSGSQAVDTLTVVADDGGPSFRGLATGFRESSTHDHVHIFSMWVDPAVRRAGVGRDLVEAVCAWARGLGVSAVHLDVTVTNEPAIRLYEACGFVATGRTEPLPHTPSVLEQEMERRL